MAEATRRRRRAAAETRREPPPASDADGPAAPPRVVAGACLALVALTLAVYLPVTTHRFVNLDDPSYFTHNPHLDGQLSLEDARRALLEPYFANWIPVTHLSIALDDALHGARPGAVLATNALIHALAGVLLLLALLRMTGRLAASAFVAGVFLLHPLHVESVAWASSRKDVLVGLFWMATLLCYARFVERPGPGRYAALATSLLLALLSKPTAVTLPFALLLLDVWPLRRLGPGTAEPWGARGVWLEKLPLLALAAVASAITWSVQGDAGATEQVPLPLRVANAARSLVAYLGDAVWPSGLAAFYPYPAGGVAAGTLVASLALLAAVTVACLALARREPSLLVGWLWFAGTLVPTLGLVQVGLQARADRYMYLPLVGLSLALAFGLPQRLAPLRRSPRLATALGGAALLALALAAHAQVRLWRDTETLFGHAVAVTEDNYFAHQLVGGALRERGELEGAERELREAVRIKPASADARVDLAALLIDRGRTGEARAQLEQARTNGADTSDFHTALALAAEREGRTAEAIAGYRAALSREPGQREAANNLAWLLATSADPGLRAPDEALRLVRGVLARDPDDPLVLDTLAAAEAASGRAAEAARTQARALALLPGDAPAALRADLEGRLVDYRRAAGDGSVARP